MRRNETDSGGGGKKRKQDEFIAALLTHSSVESAANAAGISRATGWRWLQRQDVLERLRQARQQAWSRAMAQLQEAGPEAVEALRKILREAKGEAPRVSAARTILELGVRAVELVSIEERIGKLETLAKNNWKGLVHDQPADRAQAGGARNINGHG
jgi:hypothetical protein